MSASDPIRKKQFCRFPIPLPSQSHAELACSYPMSENDWQHLIDVVQAMKPGLVAETTEEGGENEDA